MREAFSIIGLPIACLKRLAAEAEKRRAKRGPPAPGRKGGRRKAGKALTTADVCFEIIKPATASHPDSAKADFLNAQWLLNDEPFTPNAEASLTDNGIDHKSMLTVTTPDLKGMAGVGY